MIYLSKITYIIQSAHFENRKYKGGKQSNKCGNDDKCCQLSANKITVSIVPAHVIRKLYCICKLWKARNE